MAYTVYNGERCVRVAVDNGRCALTDGHHGLHTTASGGRFSTQGGKYLSGDPLRRPTAGVPHSTLERRIDVLREATLMNVEQLSERIERLERQLTGGTLENHRVRLERIEQDLRDTHDLAERAATAHLERKPEQWNADSDEPSRLCRYQDSCGYVWEYSSSRYGWHWEKNPGNLRKLAGPFIPWDGLRCDPRADFPWKVWTNG